MRSGTRRSPTVAYWPACEDSRICETAFRVLQSVYYWIGIGRKGADSEPSFGGGLSTQLMRQYPKEQAVNVTSSKGVSAPTAQDELEGTPESADACWRPCGTNNTGRPYTVGDWGNGGLALPAVHQSDTVGLPVPERAGSPVIELRT